MIAYDVERPGTIQDLNAMFAVGELNEIAAYGGTDRATSVATSAELRDALTEIIQGILDGE